MACRKVGNAIVCGPKQREKTDRFGSQYAGYKTKADKSKAATDLLKNFHLAAVGREYLVSKYWTGNFRGVCIWISEIGTTARFRVTDPMKNVELFPCSFPGCLLEDAHGGDHELTPDVDDVLRIGSEVEVLVSACKLLPTVIERVRTQGEIQVTKQGEKMEANENS